MRKSATRLQSKKEVQLAFGRAVRRMRDVQQLTQEQLAELTDVHVTYISQIERGLKNLSLFNVYRLARALNCSVADLAADADLR